MSFRSPNDRSDAKSKAPSNRSGERCSKDKNKVRECHSSDPKLKQTTQNHSRAQPEVMRVISSRSAKSPIGIGSYNTVSQNNPYLFSNIQTLLAKNSVSSPVPQVIHGRDGRDGIDGRHGRDGINGRDGADGKDSEPGPPGRDGKDGPAGRDGKDGKDGAPGPAGRDGVDGKDGAPGRDGKDGAMGLPGPAGKDGAPGPAGAPGRDGKDGVDGAMGLPGPAGKDGIDGAPGKDGRDGIDGKNGRDGIDGKDGAPGRDGIDGKDGKDGAPGKDGKDGRDGPPGPTGRHGRNALERNFAKSIYVDLYGNDEIAEPYSLTKPFASLEAAEKNSQEGDVIFVSPGTYHVTSIGLPNRTWILSHGTLLVKKVLNQKDLAVVSIDTSTNAIPSSALKISSEVKLKNHIIQAQGDFIMKGPGVIDTKGYGLLFLDQRQLSQITIEGIEITNSSVDNFETCFDLAGGHQIELHLTQVRCAKQSFLSLCGSDSSQPKLNFTARSVSVGGNGVCFSLADYSISRIDVGTLTASTSAICVSGGEHTIHANDINGVVSLNSGTTALTFETLLGSLIVNSSTLRVQGSLLSGDSPLSLTGKVQGNLRIDKINFISTGGIFNLDSGSDISIDSHEIKGDSGEAFSLQTPLVYSAGLPAEMMFNIRNVSCRSLFTLASNVAAKVHCQILRALLTQSVVTTGQLDGSFSLNFRCDEGIARDSIFVSDNSEPTSPPKIILAGSWNMAMPDNHFKTKYPLIFSNFELNGIKK